MGALGPRGYLVEACECDEERLTADMKDGGTETASDT
jgi:hypothetical protein